MYPESKCKFRSRTPASRIGGATGLESLWPKRRRSIFGIGDEVLRLAYKENKTPCILRLE
jgi:hypothetical protein